MSSFSQPLMINILGHGMIGEEDEQSDTGDMDPAKTGEMIRAHRDLIVAVKTAHFGGTGYTTIDRAREAGRQMRYHDCSFPYFPVNSARAGHASGRHVECAHCKCLQIVADSELGGDQSANPLVEGQGHGAQMRPTTPQGGINGRRQCGQSAG